MFLLYMTVTESKVYTKCFIQIKKKPLASKAIYVDTYTKTHIFIIFYNIIIIHIYIYAI